MNRSHAIIFLVLLISFAGATGCAASKVRFEKVTEVDPKDGSKVLIVDGPKKEQKVRIEIIAQGPIDVVVKLEKHLESFKDNLAEKHGEKEFTLEVTIPAGEPFCIVLTAPSKTSVTVKAQSI